MKIIFHTKLSVDECVQRIKDNPKNLEFSKRFTSLLNYDYELFYKINKNQIRLERAIISQNTLKPIFLGKIINSSKGTELVGEFKTYQFTQIFFIFWFGLVIIGGIDGAIALLALPDAEGSPLPLLLGSLLMTCFGAFIFKLMTNEAKVYQKQTIQFIEKTIEAKMQNHSTQA